MNSKPKTKRNILSVIKNPIFLGFFLIVLISGYFIYQIISEKQLTKKLEKELAKESTGKIQITTVSPRDVFRWINNPNVQLVDIRQQRDYKIKHIEKSINIPLDDNLEKNIKKIDTTKKIVVIDREDSEQGKIFTKHFQNEGFDFVYLEGGILNYARQNFPLITKGNITQITDQMKVNFLTPQQIKQKMLQGKVFSFVDTRISDAFLDDHIDGSRNFPLEKLEKEKNNLPAHTLLIYDSDILRSFQAGVKLYDMGIFDFYVCSTPYEELKKILFQQRTTTKN